MKKSHADWLVPNAIQKLDSHKCNNYIAANCPGINLRNQLRNNYVTDVNPTICTASKISTNQKAEKVSFANKLISASFKCRIISPEKNTYAKANQLSECKAEVRRRWLILI